MSNSELPHDAYLKGALKHAPDAELGPAPDLSAFILREAQAKARDPAPVAPRPRPRGVWAWLASPSVATGFAGVMVAVLVGLMWWDQPMDEALPRRPGPPALPRTSTPAPAAKEEAASPAAPAVPPATPATATPDASLAAAPPQLADNPASRERAVSSRAEFQDSKKRAVSEARVAQDTAAAKGQNRLDEAAPLQAKPSQATTPPAAAPAPAREPDAGAAPAPAPALARAAAPTAAAKPAPVTPITAEAESVRPGSDERLQGGTPGTNALRTAAPTPAKADARVAKVQGLADAAPATSLARLRQALLAEPARWTWQRGDDGPLHPATAALTRWVALLDRSVGGAWRPEPAPLNPADGELRLLRDGQLQHRFRLGEAGIDWLPTEATPGGVSATLDAASRAQLRDALEQAAP